MPETTIQDHIAVQFRALSHPLRVQILNRLAGGDHSNGVSIPSKLSPAELSRETSEPLGVVSYHFRCLLDMGMLAKAGTRPRRGAVEHFYRLTDLGRQTVQLSTMAIGGGA